MDALRKREQWRGFSPRDWLAIEQDLSCSYLYPRRCVWLLRNLTTLEYVRSDQLSPTTDAAPKNSRGLLNLITSSRLWGLLSFKDPPSRHSSSAALPVTLAQIMLLLTCFSTNVSFKERVLGFQWGVWAGHQIDVVTLEAHMDERGNKSWKNVSEAVVRDVTNLRLWSKRWMKSKHENSNLSINWEVLYNDRKAHHYWATR
ncbi:hypothetical protein EJ04DRAFT_513119 [Polyplosphaeria fusca]|uniref:Uncharacterized protein n=1 Tax=Polyplosphaeria fusca TaxID=682080 RepID=A0A9P4V203_9PLEO|nr:hypothetical protein EJ04DRAFT_513119 [Polyplosphaeria fusca]